MIPEQPARHPYVLSGPHQVAIVLYDPLSQCHLVTCAPSLAHQIYASHKAIDLDMAGLISDERVVAAAGYTL